MIKIMSVLAAVALAVPLTLTAAPAALADTDPCATGTWTWDSTNTQGIQWWTVPNLTKQESTYDNEWSGDGAPAEMCASTPSQVAVYSGQPNGNTAVETFPSIQYNLVNYYGGPPYGEPSSQLTEVRTYFTHATEPASNGTTYPSIGIGSNGVDNELAGDDFWWDTAKTAGTAYEVMDWVNDQGQSPGGKLQTQDGILHIAGKYFELWCGYHGDNGESPTCTPPTLDNNFYGYFVFFEVNPATCTTPSYSCPNADDTSGYIPHLALAEWLQRHGLMDPAATMAQEQIGWEICGDPTSEGAYTIDQHLIVKPTGR